MQSERGNAIIYVLVGLVLFGAMLGGLWWVKNRVGTVQSAPVAVQETTKTDATTDTVVDQDTVPSDDTQSSTTEAQTSSTDTTQPSAATTTPNSAISQLPPESQTGQVKSSPNSVASSGPTENSLIAATALGIVAYLGTSFARSRRAL
jgi:cytoskeletal protein RodZ